MPFTDLIVHIDDSKNALMRLRTATALAVAQGAQLTGLYVLPSFRAIPSYNAMYPDDYVGLEWIEAAREAAQARAKEQEATFRAAAAESGLQSRWYCVEGEPAQQFVLHARCHDLAIIGQADPQDPAAINGWFAGQVLLGAGRPVLIIPYIGCQLPVGQRVLIAWNGSREVVRAVHDALPLLAAAKQVTVLTIHPAAMGELDTLSGNELCQHLGRHGITAVPASQPCTDIEIGDALLSRAADESADLIVMGAYGHSRLREIVLGGSTRHLLQHMTVPMLMSH